MATLQKSLEVLRPYLGKSVDSLLSLLKTSPRLSKALIAVLALSILRSVNRSLSTRALNNWQSQRPWDNKRELVLITGGCSGIGKQIMLELAEKGVKVVILDLNEPTFKLPPNVFFYTADVTSTANIKAVGDAIRAAHGDPTVLVNNAGVGYGGTILDEPEQRIQQTFQVNTISHFWMVREFLPAMIRENHGHVITIASMASFVALGEMADYSGSKASALAFHESLSQELRLWYNAKKVRTSIIHPLWVRTPMIQQLTRPGAVFNMPLMTVEVVSNAVVKQILSQRSGQVILPSGRSGISLLRAFPLWWQERARGFGSKQLRALRDIDTSLKQQSSN
ncbi:hypothetical protein ACJ72_06079 [Emergomyces africanus]|uniref:Short-chain dehydrogenase/reductase 3 n=1 Tax=Emergomyces africanus TaxID=1955775 RepID=A0A1B7NS30_9EURO|nr:hypothetical protein ACJ72_06079 [Emergomyces africanus]